MIACEKSDFEPVVYNNTNMYRNEMRRVFSMNAVNYPAINEDIDQESKDELEYDEENVSRALDRLYSKTKDHPLFTELYEKAAACMFSVEPEIGLTILCSYDYLDTFIPCYQEYMLTGELNTTSINYVDLSNKLYH